ncbi:MAG TPA: hypothetical protein VJU77_19000 [Chthoniobacterales bacterium]|nr:hypothetical protein [Chthoniobacterales bacterium]
MKPRYFDLSKPLGPGPRKETKLLLALKSGEQLIHDHAGFKTPMRSWMWQLNRRWNRKFRYGRSGRANSEKYWIRPELVGDANLETANR